MAEKCEIEFICCDSLWEYYVCWTHRRVWKVLFLSGEIFYIKQKRFPTSCEDLKIMHNENLELVKKVREEFERLREKIIK